MNLGELLKEIEKNRPNSEMVISTTDNPGTIRGREGLKKAALETIRRMENSYADELRKAATFIVVTGSLRESFAELSQTPDFGCFTADPNRLFVDVASNIDASLFGREGTKHLFSIASNVLQDKASDLGIESYNYVMFSDKYNSGVKTKEDFIPLFRQAVLDQVGSEMVGIYAVNSIVKTAIDRGHQAQVTPIVLSVSDENFALDLSTNLKTHVSRNGERRGLTPRVFLVVAGKSGLHGTPGAVVVKKVSEETVGEALMTIRNKIL